MKIIFFPKKIVLDYHVGGLIEVKFVTVHGAAGV